MIDRLESLSVTTVSTVVLLCGLALSSAHAAEPAADDQKTLAPATDSLAASGGAPTTEELAGATYEGLGDESISLTEGSWEGEPFAPGGASRPRVGLVERFRLTGDLDSNGEEEAVVLLWASSGGSGTFSHLAVAGRRDGRVVNLGTADIGDRVQVRAGRIIDGKIELEVIEAGPKDAACCPTQKATRTWELTNDGLMEAAAQMTGTLSLDDLSAAKWILSRWTREEAAAPEPEITLMFLEGGVSGTGGCNRYRAGVTAGDRPGSLSIGRIVSTRMACPGPLMDLENRYFTALENATGYSFLAGQLVLSYKQDETHHSLTFIATELEP